MIPAVEISGLRKRYRRVEALRGIEYYYDISDLGEDRVDAPYPHNPSRLEAVKVFSDVLGHYSWGQLSYESVYGDPREIDRLVGALDRRGYTVIPTAMYWSHGRAKVEIGMARGKRQHDKRKTEKDRDWERQKGRIMKRG